MTANNKPLKQRKHRISFPSFHYHIFNWLGISFAIVKTNSAKSLLQIWAEGPGTELGFSIEAKKIHLQVKISAGGSTAGWRGGNVSSCQLAPAQHRARGFSDGEEHTEMDLLTWSEGTREGNRNDYSKKDIKRKYSGKSPSGSSEASSWVRQSPECDEEITSTIEKSILRTWEAEGPGREALSEGMWGEEEEEEKQREHWTNYAHAHKLLTQVIGFSLALLPLFSSPLSSENEVLTKPKH